MSVKTTSGARFYIGTSNAIGSGSPALTYETETWTEVGEVENLGEFGDEATLVNFLSVKDGRTRKLVGSRDAGTLALVCGRDPLDAGQIAMKAAAGTKFDFNFKVVAADAQSEDFTDSIFYFSGPVASQRNSFGGGDDVTKITFNIGINTSITEDASQESP